MRTSHLGNNSALGSELAETAGSFARLVADTASKSITGENFSIGGISGAVSQQVLSAAARKAAQYPKVQVNKARAAAVADYGYEKLEMYEAWRPTIFATSSAACLVSVAMGVKRRKVPEAIALYSLSAALTGTLAWLTRPDALRPAPAPMPPQETDPDQPVEPRPGAMAQVLGWVDRRVDRLNTTEPGWQPRTWQRLAADLGFGTIKPPVSDLLYSRPPTP